MFRGPFLIGIAGGTASGKTSFCKKVIEQLHLDSVLLEMDLFYKPLAPGARYDNFNFDHPSAIDFEYISQVLSTLLQGQPAEVPVYNFKTCSREPETRTLQPCPIIFYEGIYALYDSAVRDLMKLKIFVHTDDEIRLVRRIQRDIVERGRDLDWILTQYLAQVKPAFEEFIQPTMKHADIIVPNWRQNPSKG
jgi:uridine kinase